MEECRSPKPEGGGSDPVSPAIFSCRRRVQIPPVTEGSWSNWKDAGLQNRMMGVRILPALLDGV